MATEYRRAYQIHKWNASKRCIGWEFTFDTWLQFWRDSGHLHERGLKGNGYVMSRLNDLGPYSVENCEIVRSSENLKQQQVTDKRNKTLSERPEGWTRAGDFAHLRDREHHPKARAVIAPDGKRYASTALAGEAHGYTRARIGQMCRGRERGWKYKE